MHPKKLLEGGVGRNNNKENVTLNINIKIETYFSYCSIVCLVASVKFPEIPV
jgi:hypothetical protein